MKVISYNINRNGPEPQRRYRELAAQIYSHRPDIVFLHEVIEHYIGEFHCVGYGIRMNIRCGPTVLYKLQYGQMITYNDCGVIVSTPSCTIASIHAKSGSEFEHIRQAQAYTMFNHCVRRRLPIILIGDVNTEGDFGFFTDPRYFRELYTGATWFSNRSNLRLDRTYSKRYDRAFCSVGMNSTSMCSTSICSTSICSEISRLSNEPTNGVYSSDHDGIMVSIGIK